VYEGDGKIGHYMGGYTDWAETRDALAEERAKQAAPKSESTGDTRGEKQKKLKFTFKEQKEYETIDEDIANLESEIESVDAEINKCGSDFGKLQKLTLQREELEAALEQKMERWVYLNDLAEQIEAQKK
jgi:ATP-binding cassette subfamily F protein uup